MPPAMVNQCPVCAKQFSSKSALRNHTGTNNAALRCACICYKCNQRFCSSRAMEQHRDAPSHDTMFSCDMCKRKFASKHAEGQHKKSSSHGKMLARMKSAVGSAAGYVVRMPPHPKNASSPQVETCTRSPDFIPFKDGTRSGTNISINYPNDEDDKDDNEEGTDEEYWAPNYSRGVWDEEQNWVLCDKDCGWCGHCGDNVDY